MGTLVSPPAQGLAGTTAEGAGLTTRGAGGAAFGAASSTTSWRVWERRGHFYGGRNGLRDSAFEDDAVL